MWRIALLYAAVLIYALIQAEIVGQLASRQIAGAFAPVIEALDQINQR